MDYRRLFPELFAQLEREYYDKQRDAVRSMSSSVLAVLASEAPNGPQDRLGKDERAAALATIAALVKEHGYPRKGLREPLAAMLRLRDA